MKAIVYTEYGSPDVLQLKELAKPVPTANHVLVKVHAASANALDFRRFQMPSIFGRFIDVALLKAINTVLGADIAGRVEAVGAAVTCTLDNPPLAAGQAASPITVTTKVLSSAVGFLVNTGVVSTPGDVNPANNRSTVRTPVTHVLGTKIVKSPAKPAAVRATRVPGVLPFTGWNTSTAITLALALLFAAA